MQDPGNAYAGRLPRVRSWRTRQRRERRLSDPTSPSCTPPESRPTGSTRASRRRWRGAQPMDRRIAMAGSVAVRTIALAESAGPARPCQLRLASARLRGRIRPDRSDLGRPHETAPVAANERPASAVRAWPLRAQEQPSTHRGPGGRVMPERSRRPGGPLSAAWAAPATGRRGVVAWTTGAGCVMSVRRT